MSSLHPVLERGPGASRGQHQDAHMRAATGPSAGLSTTTREMVSRGQSDFPTGPRGSGWGLPRQQNPGLVCLPALCLM